MIYFVQDTVSLHIKIGHVDAEGLSAAEARKKALQTGNPSRLAVLATAPGTMADESKLHRTLEADNVCGEWFRASPKVLAVMMEAAAAGGELAVRAMPGKGDVLLTAAEARELAWQVAVAAEKAFRRGFQHGHMVGSGHTSCRAVTAKEVNRFRWGDCRDGEVPPGMSGKSLPDPAERLRCEVGQDRHALDTLWRLVSQWGLPIAEDADKGGR